MEKAAVVKTFMPVTDTSDPQYYHKVVDCQYACPAHTPVPEYIRKISHNMNIQKHI